MIEFTRRRVLAYSAASTAAASIPIMALEQNTLVTVWVAHIESGARAAMNWTLVRPAVAVSVEIKNGPRRNGLRRGQDQDWRMEMLNAGKIAARPPAECQTKPDKKKGPGSRWGPLSTLAIAKAVLLNSSIEVAGATFLISPGRCERPLSTDPLAMLV